MPNPLHVMEAGEAAYVGAKNMAPSAVRFVEEYLAGIIKSETKTLALGSQTAVAMRSPEGAAIVFTDPLVKGSVQAIVEKEGFRTAVGFSDGARILGGQDGARLVVPGKLTSELNSIPVSGQSRMRVLTESGQLAQFDALGQTRWQGRLDGLVLPGRTNAKTELGEGIALESRFDPVRGRGPGGRRPPRPGSTPLEHFNVSTEDAQTGMRTMVATDNGGSTTISRYIAEAKERVSLSNRIDFYVSPGRQNGYHLSEINAGKYNQLLNTPYDRTQGTNLDMFKGFFK